MQYLTNGKISNINNDDVKTSNSFTWEKITNQCKKLSFRINFFISFTRIYDIHIRYFHICFIYLSYKTYDILTYVTYFLVTYDIFCRNESISNVEYLSKLSKKYSLSCNNSNNGCQYLGLKCCLPNVHTMTLI